MAQVYWLRFLPSHYSSLAFFGQSRLPSSQSHGSSAGTRTTQISIPSTYFYCLAHRPWCTCTTRHAASLSTAQSCCIRCGNDWDRGDARSTSERRHPSSSSTHTNATPDRGKIQPSKLTSTVLAGTVDGATSMRGDSLLAMKSKVVIRRMSAPP